MSSIRKLPQHLINRLKAGEIVERPASVVKECIENSLDAGATQLVIEIEKGGKQRISIQDNGQGIATEDLSLVLERYATSKIYGEKDLEAIASYGFRGEALATIAEVSTCRIQTKTAGADPHLGYELRKDGEHTHTTQIPFSLEHGTTIHITDIFHAVPAREKFLKSDATERGYIKKIVLQYALLHRDKSRILRHNGKDIFHVSAAKSMLERVGDLTKSERQVKLKPLARQDEQLEIYGLAGDASLHFPKGQRVHLRVNGRPVEDRLLKRAVMDAYSRQLVPGMYPFVLLVVDIDPQLVDVNVHPRKMQVKFLDPGSMFTRVKQTIQEVLGDTKVNYASFTKPAVQYGNRSPVSQQDIQGLQEAGAYRATFAQNASYGAGHQQSLDLTHSALVSPTTLGIQTIQLQLDAEPVRIVGQLRDSYILLEGATQLYRVDQHALAERIAFEHLRKDAKGAGLQPHVLLQPLTLSYPKTTQIEPLLQRLNDHGFDISVFGEGKVIIHAIPQVFATYTIDIELVMNSVWGMDDEDPAMLFGHILDEIFGMKACKASITAGQKLSMEEMQKLMQDGIERIDGLFVCQHGRPSVIGTPKGDIDELFGR